MKFRGIHTRNNHCIFNLQWRLINERFKKPIWYYCWNRYSTRVVGYMSSQTFYFFVSKLIEYSYEIDLNLRNLDFVRPWLWDWFTTLILLEKGLEDIWKYHSHDIHGALLLFMQCFIWFFLTTFPPSGILQVSTVSPSLDVITTNITKIELSCVYFLRLDQVLTQQSFVLIFQSFRPKN